MFFCLEVIEEIQKRGTREAPGDLLDDKFVQNDNLHSSLNPAAPNSNLLPSRSAVLQACIITSGLIAALGIVIRQVSYVGSVEGFPVLDCSSEVSFGFDMWHLELITGLVVLISSCRYLLLKTWPDFAESSEAANQQVLSSLQPLDYIVVAFLPGISEELLFRGAILPLLGMNWNSIAIAALIFGVLHLGNGPNYSFAIWCISFPFPLSFLSCPPFFSFSSLCCLFLFPRISGNYHIYHKASIFMTSARIKILPPCHVIMCVHF
ncbi:hypothetical protein glysoja_010870 [Glycine soja]|nr:hypothetical protein glysoja_010870 [Glycine soja]